jgi:hypothetical protein
MRGPHLRRAAALALLTGVLAACGGGGDPATAPPTGGAPFTLPDIGATEAPATTAPARPWAAACTLFTEADVLAATDHQHSTITVVDRKETNTTLGETRVSRCSYNTMGVETYDGSTVKSTGDNWVTMEIKDRGADFVFPAKDNTEPVPGVGDEAFWDDPQNNILYVRSGDWILKFDALSPTDRAELGNIRTARRTVTLNVAKRVVPRLPS